MLFKTITLHNLLIFKVDGLLKNLSQIGFLVISSVYDFMIFEYTQK